MVTGTFALPRHIQALSGGQHRFQKQISVVFAASPVACACLPRLADQVKVARGGTAWVRVVVHAQQANDFERNGSHRHERGKLHTPGRKPLLQANAVELRQPMAAQHTQGQRCVKPSQLTVSAGVFQWREQLIQHALVGIVCHAEKPFRQLLPD